MKIGKTQIKRLQTGVPGLDEVLGGGLPEFSFNLIYGRAGCGKTTLAHQLMFALTTPERPALYFTALGEPPIKMLRYQQQFDFYELEQLNHAIRFVNLAELAATGDLDQLMARIMDEVKACGPGLVFIDSYSTAAVGKLGAAESELNMQRFSHEMGVQLSNWQATTFLIGDFGGQQGSEPVFTVADGILHLQQNTVANSVVRQMEIVKVRGQPSLPGLHTFSIGTAGLQVFAPARYEQPTQGGQAPGARLSLGVPRLDAMLGGGLPKGYSLLVAGPSGSGKSILAAAFLAEGAARNETGVIAAFEQRSQRSRGPVIAELIEQGRITVVDTRSPTLSVDEIAYQLLAEIRRTGASRVVIDSLSGFELALAPSFRADFRASLARLVAALASTDVTVLMTSELEDRYNELSFSPYGTAFLTDAIIVQRYVEIDGSLRRVMAVVKVRGSEHAKELRLFSIDAQGIQLGDRPHDLEGLLSGHPRRPALVTEQHDHG